MRRVALLVAALLVAGCVGGIFRADRGQYTRRRHREWCQIAYKQGWCDKTCGRQPDSCKPNEPRVPAALPAWGR